MAHHTRSLSLGTTSIKNRGRPRPGDAMGTLDIPERFRGEEDEEDEEDGGDKSMVQQSMYGIIAAAAQGKGSFRTTLQTLSGSESESEGEAPEEQDKKKEKRKSVLKSFLRPGRGGREEDDGMVQSQRLPPRDARPIRRDAPVLDQRLQAAARANLDSSAPTSTRTSREGTPSGSTRRKKAPVALPEALADIFQFDKPEDVISEYSCWYLQSVLLQGYMYITQKHVCFYAYLQKKGNIVKSGHLSKQGKRNPRYRRYWFILQGDVLSYYASAAEPYFPSGTIDLRYAISAEAAPEKDATDKGTSFVITTEGRTYHFRADSAASAKEWVRQLQKIIFRARNDGDSVKISIPLENILDVEANPVVEAADTLKIRVLAADDSYAIDEYFFTFFANGQDALNVLTTMTADNEAKKVALDGGVSSPLKTSSPFKQAESSERSPRLSVPLATEPVRSTLSPVPPADRSSSRVSSDHGRSSGEFSRSSFDRGRRSVSASRRTSQQWRRQSKSPLSLAADDSMDSGWTGSDSQSTATGEEVPDHMSASQVLGGDDLFRAPTMKMPQPRRTVSGNTVQRLRQESREQSPQSPANAPIRVQPPSRSQSEQSLTQSPSEIEQVDYFPMPRQGQETTSTMRIPISRPMRALATPLQHAFTLADVVREGGKRGISYLSSSPKDYYNRFSGAIAGGRRHYNEGGDLGPDDRVDDVDDDLDTAEHERRFQQHFALAETEKLRAVFYCWLHRVLPLYGKIYLSDRRFCFRSLIYGTRTKLVVPYRDIQNVGKEKGFRWGYPGMVLVIRGHEELFFDFGNAEVRDDCTITVLRGLEVARDSWAHAAGEQEDADDAAMEHELLQDARRDSSGHEKDIPLDSNMLGSMPILFDDPNASVLDFRPKQSLRITCLTIGSRGDVQPYIALCKRLVAQGHHAKIATHSQFEPWIRKHGVDFAPVVGDPAELMRICVEHGMFTPSFVLETSTYARGWLQELLETSWSACQDTDILIESPSAMAGFHIAEALRIPYFRAFTMPWTKTRAYPHAFAVPSNKMGGQFNYMTYVIFENLFWTMTARQINRWRRKSLALPPTDLGKMQLNKVPFLYNFSPSVVTPPLDFSDWIRITGYWWLDEANDWTPDPALVAFLKKARDDDQKIVYIGFGSIPVRDTQTLTQQIISAVLKAGDVRCVFSKGWSDHFDNNPSNTKSKTLATTPASPSANPASAPTLPPEIFQIRSAPHDWLFARVDAAVHHGGAGTTGASLRAGLPTVIRPFFGDQFFFATRVEDLGVGIHLKKLTVNALGKAIWRATHDGRMKRAAGELAAKIADEDGVGTAVEGIWRDLEYAKTLVGMRGKGGAGDGDEESWTFVDGEEAL